MPRKDTITQADGSAGDFAAALVGKLAGLTRPDVNAWARLDVAEGGAAADFNVSYPVSWAVNGVGNVITRGQGIGVSRILPTLGRNFAPVLLFDGATLGGGVDSTVGNYKTDLAAVAGLSIPGYGYRTRSGASRAVGVFCDTPWDNGGKDGWGSWNAFSMAGVVNLHDATPWPNGLGLGGCLDVGVPNLGVLGPTGSTEFLVDPWLECLKTVGGQLCYALRLRDDTGTVREFSMPLGAAANNPVLRRGIEVDFVNGVAYGFIGRTQVAVTGTWPAGRKLADSFETLCTLGAVGVEGPIPAESYVTADLTLCGQGLHNALRFQNRGAGQAQRLIGESIDLAAHANPDNDEYRPNTIACQLDLGANAFSPPWWHCWYRSNLPNFGAGCGYWLRTAGDDPTLTTSGYHFRDLSLLGGANTQGGGAGIHLGVNYDVALTEVELGQGSRGAAKVFANTLYVGSLRECRARDCSTGALKLGYGIWRTRSFDLNPNCGRVGLAGAKPTLVWGRDMSFWAGNAGFKRAVSVAGPRSGVFSGINLDSEGAVSPSQGVIVLDLRGSDEADPAVVWEAGGVGTVAAGVPVFDLRGAAPGTPSGSANRPGRLVLRDLPPNFFAGTGPLYSTARGGRWRVEQAATGTVAASADAATFLARGTQSVRGEP